MLMFEIVSMTDQPSPPNPRSGPTLPPLCAHSNLSALQLNTHQIVLCLFNSRPVSL